MRLLVGNQDWLYDNRGKLITKIFSDYLVSLNIKNEYKVIDGVGHMLPDTFETGQIEYPIQFWVDAFKDLK